jgi:hypothetical protein
MQAEWRGSRFARGTMDSEADAGLTKPLGTGPVRPVPGGTGPARYTNRSGSHS